MITKVSSNLLENKIMIQGETVKLVTFCVKLLSHPHPSYQVLGTTSHLGRKSVFSRPLSQERALMISGAFPDPDLEALKPYDVTISLSLDH